MSGTAGRGVERWAIPTAVFLGAFLLFQVQPLLGRLILPWYGGTPTVWTTCLVVFQTLLLAGYAWADLLRRLRPRAQVTAHLALLVVAAAVSIVPAASWKPAGAEAPWTSIVGLIAATAGTPYVALAASGPLLQAWHWRCGAGGSPYRLYALSNAGSLLALVSYPFVVEPRLGLARQAQVWRGMLVTFVGLCVLAAWGFLARGSSLAAGPAVAEPAPRAGQRARAALWIGWSACGVILFMAVTNQLTLNVAPVPFLWVLPLSIYLAAFVVAFSGPRAYPRAVLTLLAAPAAAAVWLAIQDEVHAASGGTARLSIGAQIALHAGALLVLCLVCHGELYRLRPPPTGLTRYYLAIAAGGALGGLVVAVLAPLLFQLYQELQLGVLLCGGLVVLTRLRDRSGGAAARERRLDGALAVGLLVLCSLFAQQTWTLLRDVRLTRRGFFGVLRVQEVGQEHPGARALRLWNGATVHGYQFLSPALATVPAGYYTGETGIGAALLMYRREGPWHVGVVGLGAGALASYGRAGDRWRLYEINPDVIEVARTEFSFLARSAARLDVVVGDARLSLEREPDQRFDLLILDAFSSDSVPVHLLTREAFALYDRHLLSTGVLAVHVSNRHLDLPRVIHPAAGVLGLRAMEVHSRARVERLRLDASWMILTRDAALLDRVAAHLAPLRQTGEVILGTRRAEAGAAVWTDDYSNPFGILR